jgi:hypothetical protein
MVNRRSADRQHCMCHRVEVFTSREGTRELKMMLAAISGSESMIEGFSF